MYVGLYEGRPMSRNSCLQACSFSVECDSSLIPGDLSSRCREADVLLPWDSSPGDLK
ncbi:hypothetical protein DPMN_045171 [Dreissena polymorpha]|uniref:Uncharacterized protein n=1 Tax=Dreissena polymorpha TaxID=45954 RepID=A0A9D4HZE4_DREPO|nr:hypothetical protein DPMN_045171 [Dreissena polymorpha]